MIGPELFPDCLGDRIGCNNPLIGCFGSVIAFFVSASLARLFLEFQCGAEVVLHLAPLVGVEIVHEGDQLRVVETVIAKSCLT